MLLNLILFLVVSLLGRPILAAFGITTNTDSYVVDAGSTNSLVITVDRDNCDITSIKFMGTEYAETCCSQIGSGLGSATVSATTVNSKSHSLDLVYSQADDGIGQYAKITCVTDTLTHYYVIQSGQPIIFMATYTTAEPSVGELRYISRLNADLLPNEYPFGSVSNIDGGTAIEGSDVFLVGSQTRSKFYSSERFIDDSVHCVYSDSVHACMLMPQYETSSGGPFFRDINTNNVGSYTGLYWYMNSGHVQTESYRQGLHGPYAMYWSRSGIPTTSNVDFSFFEDLGITGYVAESGRGYVSGTATGVSSSYEIVVHWYNSAAQYWAYASSSGAFTSPAMKPGTYTMVLYQTELKVASTSVTVTAGSTTSKSIASTLTSHTTLFLIGTWDGQPTGFRNAANQLRMHPSDSRMESWGPVTYTVGSSSASTVPMALFKSVNDPLTITASLTSSQASGAAVFRVGTTLSFAGGRPSVTVNGNSLTVPAAPTKIDSRGVTRGAYRGYGEIYDFTISSGVLVSGTNTFTISVASGSSGDEYLEPNFILDAIELYR
jgi:rhamnogalacturonan endolyase